MRGKKYYLLNGDGYRWIDFSYKDVYLKKAPDGNYFIYLKETGQQVSLGNERIPKMTWAFTDRNIVSADPVKKANRIHHIVNQYTGEIKRDGELIGIVALPCRKCGKVSIENALNWITCDCKELKSIEVSGDRKLAIKLWNEHLR